MFINSEEKTWPEYGDGVHGIRYSTQFTCFSSIERSIDLFIT